MKWFVRILQGLVALDFLMAGAMKIFSSADQIKELYTDKLGTPAALIYAVGVTELLAALVLIAGYRYRMAAIASIAVILAILIGATVACLAAARVADAMLPFGTLIVVAFLLYFKRDAIKSFRKMSGANLTSK
ncbi:MAG: DoxX family protein [Cohnella sp.]|nr:DoxX family protein [Cohnella sp.]